jgi:hypothetical protein
VAYTSDKAVGPTGGRHTFEATAFFARLVAHIPHKRHVQERYYTYQADRTRAEAREAEEAARAEVGGDSRARRLGGVGGGGRSGEGGRERAGCAPRGGRRATRRATRRRGRRGGGDSSRRRMDDAADAFRLTSPSPFAP